MFCRRGATCIRHCFSSWLSRRFPNFVPVEARQCVSLGVAIVPVEVGHADTEATTMLHVPETGLLVPRDVVYNGVYLYLTETGGIKNGSCTAMLAILVASVEASSLVAEEERWKSPPLSRSRAA